MDVGLKQDEYLDFFVDRFNDLRGRAYDQVSPTFLMVSRFMNALLPKLKGQVNIVRQSKGFTDDRNVDVVIRTTRNLLSTMTAVEVKNIMKPMIRLKPYTILKVLLVLIINKRLICPLLVSPPYLFTEIKLLKYTKIPLLIHLKNYSQ